MLKKALTLGLTFGLLASAHAEGEWSNLGEVSFQFRKFKNDHDANTEDTGMLIFSRVEASYEDGPSKHVFRGFARVDQKDHDRDFMAFEDMYFSRRLGKDESWKVLAGYKLFTWTATEAFHPADVVNSRNYDSDVEFFEKKGELTLEVSKEFDWGIIEAFYWPKFEEPQFPGQHSRLGYGVDLNRPQAIDGTDVGEKWVPQGGVRVGFSLDDADIGVHIIHHVDRNMPLSGTLNYGAHPLSGQIIPLDTTSTPYYYRTTQVGGTVQYASGSNLLKFEGAYRMFQDDVAVYTTSGLQKPIDHGDLAFGYERTFEETSFGETTILAELGGIVGASKAERARLSIFQRDILFGVRHAFNDVMGKELTFLVIHDLERDRENFYTLSYSQRLSDLWKVKGGVRIYDAPKKGTYAQGLEALDEAHHGYINLIRYF